MKILIYGAGAIGSYLGGLLTEAGQDVTLMARGAQLEALATHGLIVGGKGQADRLTHVTACARGDCQGSYDLIFVTLKSMHLEAAAADISSLLATDGVTVMIQNGLPWWYLDGADSPLPGAHLSCLDSTGKLRSGLPLEQVIGAVIYKPVMQTEPGRIFLPDSASGSLVIGEVHNQKSARLEDIATLLSQAGLPTTATQNIRLAKWRKLMINLVWNSLCAITQSTSGRIAASEKAAVLVRNIIAEGLAVAHSVGMDLNLDADEELHRVAGNMDQQPSMLQDVRAGRPLEVDAIVNAVVELAAFTGVPVPTLNSIAACLDVLNETLKRDRLPIGPVRA
jgi:2-dehydropantoate 2-reductase